MSKSKEVSAKTPAHGLTKNAGTTKSNVSEIDPIIVKHPHTTSLLSALRVLVERKIASASERDTVNRILSRMLPPAQANTISQMTNQLLAGYYQGSTDPDVIDGQLMLWTGELEGYPQWAIRDAMIWWVSRFNGPAARRRKPLPGDISEVAHRIMDPVRVAQTRVRQFNEQEQMDGNQKHEQSENAGTTTQH